MKDSHHPTACGRSGRRQLYSCSWSWRLGALQSLCCGGCCKIDRFDSEMMPTGIFRILCDRHHIGSSHLSCIFFQARGYEASQAPALNDRICRTEQRGHLDGRIRQGNGAAMSLIYVAGVAVALVGLLQGLQGQAGSSGDSISSARRVMLNMAAGLAAAIFLALVVGGFFVFSVWLPILALTIGAVASVIAEDIVIPRHRPAWILGSTAASTAIAFILAIL